MFFLKVEEKIVSRHVTFLSWGDCGSLVVDHPLHKSALPGSRSGIIRKFIFEYSVHLRTESHQTVTQDLGVGEVLLLKSAKKSANRYLG